MGYFDWAKRVQTSPSSSIGFKEVAFRTVKIALVTQKYGGTGGGIERVVEELAKRLCHDHEVHVYTQSMVAKEDCSINFHRIPRIRHSWSLNLALFFILGHLYLIGHRYDIVHLHAPSLYRKGIVTCHGIPQSALLDLSHAHPELRRNILFSQIRRFVLMRPIIEYNFRRGRHKRVIAISSDIQRDLVSICKTPLEDISVVPNGVDVQRFGSISRSRARQEIQNRYGLSPDHCLFLFVGNFFKRKGVQFLLPAFARLRDDPARLIIVGNDGGQNQWAKGMIKDLGIGKSVILAGEQKDVEMFYAASDAFVFPSFYEASSLVLIEALASGLPVIASRTGGAEDIIREGENGFLLSSIENTDELSQKMEALSRDRTLRERLGEKARESASAYSWDKIARKTFAVYTNVIDRDEDG